MCGGGVQGNISRQGVGLAPIGSVCVGGGGYRRIFTDRELGQHLLEVCVCVCVCGGGGYRGVFTDRELGQHLLEVCVCVGGGGGGGGYRRIFADRELG